MRGTTVLSLAIVAVLLATTATGSNDQSSARRQVLDSVPAEFKAIFEVSGISERDMPGVWAGFPYDRIELERTACFGNCPVYRVTLFRGGRAELQATSGYPRKGRFVGEIDVFSYGRLCYLMQKLGFEELSPEYTVLATDMPTVNITVVAGERTMRVSEYGRTGPIELWGIQEAIDSVISGMEWKRRR